MKYVLMISVTAEALEALSESERQAFDDAHQSLQADTRASGELLSTHQLGDIAHTPPPCAAFPGSPPSPTGRTPR